MTLTLSVTAEGILDTDSMQCDVALSGQNFQQDLGADGDGGVDDDATILASLSTSDLCNELRADK